MRACARTRMAAEKITTEDALDLLTPSDEALSTEDAIAATQNPDDSGPTLSEIEVHVNVTSSDSTGFFSPEESIFH